MTPRQTAEKSTTASATPTQATTAKRPGAEKSAPAAAPSRARTSTGKSTTSARATAKDAPPKKSSAAKQAAAASAPSTGGAVTKSGSKRRAPGGTDNSDSPTSHPNGGSFRGIAVQAGDDPWTEAEVLAVQEQLQLEIMRLEGEITTADDHLHQLKVGASGSSSEDPVDSGAKAYERETELSIIANARQMVTVCQDALVRLSDGRYGTCDTCGGPIRKLRLQAFPRASQCLACKQRAERH